jgi:prepilin-type N-terminal cleavage/methylation domain-containing protein
MKALCAKKTQLRRGFTLTELAIVLGIMGTILGAIWSASARVSASNKVQKAQGQVLQILAGYRSLFAQRAVDVADWTDLTCMGINAGFFPSEMIPSVACGAVPTGYPVTPWGGSSYVRVWGHKTWNGIVINYVSLSQEACVSFANAAATDPTIIYENINGTTVGTGTPLGSAVFSTTAINAACVAGNTNVVYVMWAAR